MNTTYREGDKVYVKPPNAKCTDQWPQGTVTTVTDDGVIEVDGVHRHVADIRRIRLDPVSDDNGFASEESEDSDSAELPAIRRSERVTGQPWRFCSSDYDL